MADNSNIPEAEDTKTRVTAKITPGTPGKSAPKIDLENRSAAPADASSTMTRRTLKLQGLAGLAAAPKPAAAPRLLLRQLPAKMTPVPAVPLNLPVWRPAPLLSNR